MNAPANIPKSLDADMSVAERAARASISIHLPNEGDAAMACRVDIAMMRDQATAGLSRCSDAAYAVLAEVARQATLAVFAPADAKRLFQTRFALRLAMDAARALERASRNGQ